MIEFLKLLEEIAKRNVDNSPKESVDSDNDDFNVNGVMNVPPGLYVDLNVDGKDIVGVSLANNILLLIDVENTNVLGYLKDYTANIPYKIKSIRKPLSNDYKISSNTLPVLWTSLIAKKKMSIRDIEKALNLEPGSLEIS